MRFDDESELTQRESDSLWLILGAFVLFGIYVAILVGIYGIKATVEAVSG